MKPRIIFVEPQEDVDAISAKIRTSKNDTVALVIPLNAIIFQSIISVKILQSNAEKIKKQIFIITRDAEGQKFAKKLDIPTAPDLEHLEFPLSLSSLEAQKTGSKKIRSIHLRSFSSPEKKYEPIDLQKKKQEILELLSRPSKTLLFSICAVSLALLFYVTTLALPGATIHIIPQKKVIKTTINVTLTTGQMENATDSWRQYALAAIPIKSVFEKAIPFETVTKVFTGKSASGNIVLVNNLDEEISLRPGTRFQSETGLIFRSKQWVKSYPGKEETLFVEADERDTFGEFIGARGNIEENLKFFLPGLSEESQEFIFAEVREPLGGGVSGYKPEISEADIELAKVQIQEMILRDARQDSETFVERKNRLENRDLILLPGDEFLDTEILEIEIPDNILGGNIENFTVRSRMRVKMLAFSQGEMLSILRGALLKTIDLGMELVSIEENGIYPEVLSISPQKDKVKITVSIKGVEAYIIEPRTKDGVQFVNRVKENILGKSITQARKIVENFPEVAVTTISIWPPFFRHIPQLPENISVQLME